MPSSRNCLDVSDALQENQLMCNPITAWNKLGTVFIGTPFIWSLILANICAEALASEPFYIFSLNFELEPLVRTLASSSPNNCIPLSGTFRNVYWSLAYILACYLSYCIYSDNIFGILSGCDKNSLVQSGTKRQSSCWVGLTCSYKGPLVFECFLLGLDH